MTLNIVCINAGNYLGCGADYVNILADCVARNISDKIAYKFICFTDTPQCLDQEVDIRPLPFDGLDGWWNKLVLFKDGIFPDGDRIIYLDLDTVITGGLDDIIKYDGEFAVLRDFIRQEGVQSSVMAWEANTLGHIWDEWVHAGMPKNEYGDQDWIEFLVSRKSTFSKYVGQELIIGQMDYLQDVFPQSFVSYKLQAVYGIPEKSKMVIFHGNPRPHNAPSEWIKRIWKIGGGTTLEMEMVCNVEESQLISNIKNSLKLPYPWLQMHDAHDGHAVVVGGGPSLENYISEIKKRQEDGQIIFAMNNSYKYLKENGIIPNAHVMVDARKENAEFVPQNYKSWHGVESPILYYCSQCHPAVFEKTKNKNVILWHSMDEGIQQYIGDDTGDPLVGGGSTVGLKAIALAWTLGYRMFHLYGFDSSYEDGQNHAYPQSLNDKDKVIELYMNDKHYLAAPWMCTQVENFKELAKELVGTGSVITVHGTGLLPDVAGIMNIPIPAVNVRAGEILKRLNVLNPIGAEIGVFTGALSSKLLQHPDLTLYMVDSWSTSDKDSEYAKSGDFHAGLDIEQQDHCFESTKKIVQFAGEKAKIIRKPSIEAATEIPDASLDFVFIDADHSYEGCKADILAWTPKLKPGGLLSGHDYKNTEYPCFGVDKAVDEFSQETGLPMELGQNYTWFIRLAA